MAQVLAAIALALCFSREGNHPRRNSPFNLHGFTLLYQKSKGNHDEKGDFSLSKTLFCLAIKSDASLLFSRLSCFLSHPFTYPSRILSHIFIHFIPSFRELITHLLTMHLSKMRRSLLQTWEQALGGVGHFRQAQSSHRARSPKDYTEETRLWIQEITNIDNDLRGLVQRETFAREELEALKAGAAPQNESYITKLEEELQILLCLYIYESDLYDAIMALCPENPFTRGFQAWRSQPQWHLSPDLRRDCARSGGCCRRDCKCCEKPRNTTREKAQHGHCTEECGCCRRARGRNLDLRDRKHWRPAFNRNSPDRFYTKHLEAGYVLGLVKDPNTKVSPKSG